MTLRFALLVDDDLVPAWQARAIEMLLQSRTAEIVLIVRNGAIRRHLARVSRWRQLRPVGRGLWQGFERLAARRASSIRPTALPEPLRDVPRLTTRAEVLQPKTESFSDEELADIAAARPDVIIRFGFGILKGRILTVAPHGVWSYHHGDPAMIRGQPPGFWEIALGMPVTGVILQRLSAELDAGAILQQGWFGTIAHSYVQQRDQLYMGATGFLAHASKAALAGTLREQPQTGVGPVLRKPTNVEFLRFLWQTIKATAAIHGNGLFRHQDWTIGVIPRSIAEAVALLTDEHRDASAIRWRTVTADGFVADPFPIRSHTGIRIYAERLPWRTGRGELIAIDYDPEQGFSPSQPVWQPPYHCSYPYIFEDDASRWCVPETSEHHDTRRFRIDDQGQVDFSGDGLPILPEGVIDPTIIVRDGRYWLFASDAENSNTTLNIFHADGLSGPWLPHAQNPVKIDVRSARPAGRPFVVGDRLIRPGQDCSVRYGGAIRLNQIVTLTPDAFEETEWKVISPRGSRFAYGMHTISWSGDWTVIDGAKASFRMPEFTRQLRAKLGLARRA